MAIDFGSDEVKPISRRGSRGYGVGLMITDNLDVLWLAGLRAEFDRGVEWVRHGLRLDGTSRISFFETTIRCLAGLLAAHELSGEKVLLDKAEDLGNRLARAIGGGAGMPKTQISLGTGQGAIPSWLGGNVLLAEVGTFQMEFVALSEHTRRSEFRDKALHVFDVLDRCRQPPDEPPRALPLSALAPPMSVRS